MIVPEYKFGPRADPKVAEFALTEYVAGQQVLEGTVHPPAIRARISRRGAIPDIFYVASTDLIGLSQALTTVLRAFSGTRFIPLLIDGEHEERWILSVLGRCGPRDLTRSRVCARSGAFVRLQGLFVESPATAEVALPQNDSAVVVGGRVAEALSERVFTNLQLVPLVEYEFDVHESRVPEASFRRPTAQKRDNTP